MSPWLHRVRTAQSQQELDSILYAARALHWVLPVVVQHAIWERSRELRRRAANPDPPGAYYLYESHGADLLRQEVRKADPDGPHTSLRIGSRDGRRVLLEYVVPVGLVIADDLTPAEARELIEELATLYLAARSNQVPSREAVQ